MTGKRKIIAVVCTLCVILGLSVVPLASAYPVPSPVGLPGGTPTKATGGSSASQSVTYAAAASLAGYTGAELAKLRPKVTLPSGVGSAKSGNHGIGAAWAARTGSHAKSFSFSCTVSAGKSKIGAGANHNGANSLRISFTNHGKTYLRTHSGTAIRLGVKCIFGLKHGKKSTSASTVVLSP